MSGERDRSISESLVLDDTTGGVVITGITDDKIAAKSGLQAGDEIVAATIHLDHLKKNEVLDILKVLEPYDNNMKVLTKKELNPSAGLGSLGLDVRSPSEMLNLKKDLSLDTKAAAPAVSLNGLDGDIKVGQGLGGEISGPTLNGDLPSLSLNKPSAGTGASFALPSLGLNGADVKGDLDGNLKAPDVRVSTPQLNAPSVDIEKPEIKTGDAKFKPPKFSMPHFSVPSIKSPNADANISGDLDLKTPDLSVSGPDINPQLDLKTSDVKLETPNVDLNAPKKKLPHHTWKGLKLKGPKADVNAPDVNLSGPKIDGDLRAPDLDVNLPKAGIKGDVDVQTPNIEAEAPSGKWSWLPWNWNKPKVSGPKADLDIDASKPDLNLSAPKIDGEINGPDLSLPKADLKSPDINVNGPNLDIDPPSSKFTWPHKKWKKPHGPKVDLNADLNTPDLSVPKIDGPDVDLSLPKGDLDVNAPNANIEPPSGKLKFPTLKKPKFKVSGPKVDTPDVDIDAKAPTLDVPSVDVAAPDADINVPSGKIKFPTLKKPKWAISGPKASGPGLDLDADLDPNLNLKAPKIDADIKTPDANLDINGPDVEAPSGFFSGIKFPKIGGKLKGPKADLDADVNAPNLDLKTPDLDLKSPDIDIALPNPGLPNADLKAPDAQLKTPSVDLDSKRGDFKLPHFKLPKFGGSDPKVEVPSVKSGIEAPGVNIAAPSVDLSGPKVGADVRAPNLDLKAPSVDGGISTPGISLSGPEVNTNLNKPNVGISADADADIKGSPKSKLKSLFKWGRKSSSDDDVLNVRSEVDAPKADLNAPAFKFHKLPTASIDASGGSDDTFGLPKLETEAKDYVMSKGVRLPILNTTSKSGEKVDIFERLRMAKEKVPSANTSPTDSRGEIDLKLPSTSLAASAEGADSSLVRGGTFKVEKPDSVLDLAAPTISTSDDNERMSLSLTNMLGLNIKDSD